MIPKGLSHWINEQRKLKHNPTGRSEFINGYISALDDIIYAYARQWIKED